MSMDNQYAGKSSGQIRYSIDPALTASIHFKEYGYSRPIEEQGLSCWEVANDFVAATAGRNWSSEDPYWVAVEEYLEARGILEPAL